MAFPHHEAPARGQLPPPGKGRLSGFGAEEAIQPLGHDGLEPRILTAHQRGQRHQPPGRSGRQRRRPGRQVRQEQPHLARRGLLQHGRHLLHALRFQRMDPLAQHRFHGRFPARLDADVLPDALGVLAQAVLLQPGAHLVLALHARLQLLQHRHPRLNGGGLGHGRLQGLLRGPPLGLDLGQTSLQRLLLLGRARLFFLRSPQLQRQPLQLIRRIVTQLRQRRLQPLAALLHLRQRLFMGSTLHAPHLQRLLGRVRGLTCGLQRLAPFALLVLAGRQLFLGLGQCHLGRGLLLAGFFQLRLHFLAALQPALGQRPCRLDLFFQRLQTCLGLIAVLRNHPDLRFQRGDLAVDLIVGGLTAAHLVVGLVHCLAQRLHAVLGRAQPGLQPLDLQIQALSRLFQQLLLGLRIVALDEPQPLLLLRPLSLHGTVAARHLGLCIQLADLPVQLAQDVLHTRQVLARVGQAVLGLTPPLLVLRDAGSLLEEHAQLVGLGLDDARDGALTDDGVGTWPQARAQEDVVHVLATYRLLVDVVGGLPLAREHTLDRDLGKAAPRPADAAQAVVEHQLHAGTRRGLALQRAVEDHVLHRLAAQLGGARLTQHPAGGIDDVRLAAAIGTDDAHQLAGQLEGGRITE